MFDCLPLPLVTDTWCSPCCWPCRTRTGGSGWSPAGPGTSPAPPASLPPAGHNSHLKHKISFSGPCTARCNVCTWGLWASQMGERKVGTRHDGCTSVNIQMSSWLHHIISVTCWTGAGWSGWCSCSSRSWGWPGSEQTVSRWGHRRAWQQTINHPRELKLKIINSMPMYFKAIIIYRKHVNIKVERLRQYDVTTLITVFRDKIT